MRRKYWSALLPLVLLGVACQEAEEPAELAPATTTSTEAKILFDSGDPAGMDMDIYVMDPDGSHVRQVTETPPGTGSRDGDWSPDRQKIAFMSNRDGDPEVYVMAADGSDVQRLTKHRGMDGLPAWSPDGTQIAFIRDTDPPATGPLYPSRSQSIYVMDADGSNQQKVLTEEGPVFNDGGGQPAWKPLYAAHNMRIESWSKFISEAYWNAELAM